MGILCLLAAWAWADPPPRLFLLLRLVGPGSHMWVCISALGALRRGWHYLELESKKLLTCAFCRYMTS